jgi:ATP-binding cassette, subfamily G (WHITE), member 2, PDR
MPRQKYISPISLLAKRFPLPQKARVPRNRPQGVTRQQYADHFRDVAIALFGLSYTVNTRVGNEYIRGVSGGERKRVSIAEAFLAGCTLQCWYVNPLCFSVVETRSYKSGLWSYSSPQGGCSDNLLNRDNSIRGLDSPTALKFVKTLRTSSSIIGTTSIVAIYQASQTAYDVRSILLDC